MLMTATFLLDLEKESVKISGAPDILKVKWYSYDHLFLLWLISPGIMSPKLIYIATYVCFFPF